jgi:cell wall-associated NlpC family hydrolase
MKFKLPVRLVVFAAAFVVVLSSCHSKKLVMRGQPGQIVQPQPNIAEKYAQLMQVNAGDITNGRLYTFIEEWAGTPYKFGGEDKNGIDCSGLVQLLQQQVYGINIPRMTSQQVTVIKRKYEEDLKEGDLVFFDFDNKQFSHVGVYLQNGYVVHASSTKGVMIVKLHSPSMYKYFSRCGSVIDQPVTAQN